MGYNLQLHFWHQKRTLLYLLIPLMVGVLLIVCSISQGWIYRISPDNHAIRGSIYFVYIAICCFYMLGTGFIAGRRVFIRRYYSDKLLYLALASCGVLPAFFFVLEYFTGTHPFSVYSMVVAVLWVFLELQSRMISTDPLTKLNNRNQRALHFALWR